MKDTLVQIINALQKVETKGEGTLIMADCVRALIQLVQEEQKGEEDEQRHDN